MDNDELSRLAAEELEREARRGQARAQVAGSLAWLPGTVPNTDKRFLANTLRHTLASNRLRDRRDRGAPAPYRRDPAGRDAQDSRHRPPDRRERPPDRRGESLAAESRACEQRTRPEGGRRDDCPVKVRTNCASERKGDERTREVGGSGVERSKHSSKKVERR